VQDALIRLESICEAVRTTYRSVVALTGAGVSAESGVPTFRGKEGYWRVGSINYHPQELATASAFRRMPEDLWAWYLNRRAACSSAEPNAAHVALAQLERSLGEQFLLITQNVDGLHRRAGSSPERTYEIHGNIHWMRCSAGCGAEAKRMALEPVPTSLDSETDRDKLARVLRCTNCGCWMRPHVLWFDECYDEANFRFESSLAAADRAAVLLIVGTTGTTNLPDQMGRRAADNGAVLIAVNPEPTLFSDLAERTGGLFLKGTAGRWVPQIARHLSASG
jgi:NAD-dependent deacetylase